MPPFWPVPLRARHDGWTPERQIAFLSKLVELRAVTPAARAVGMGRESAYRLRKRPGADSFAAAWDAALSRAPAPKSTVALPKDRVFRPGFKLVIYRGRHVGTQQVFDDVGLLRLLRRVVGRTGRHRGAPSRMR